MPIKSEPTPLTENLWGLEIDPFREIEENWATVKDYLSTLFASQGVDDIVAEELSILPGMDELFSLLKIRQFYEKEAYDVIVVDCAPTGATLRLLHFPDMIGWYMRRLFHVERKVVGTIRRFTDEIFSVPLPGDEVYDTVERLYKRVGDMKAVLADPKITSIRLVLNPEKMVIEETRRAYTYLNLFGFVLRCRDSEQSVAGRGDGRILCRVEGFSAALFGRGRGIFRGTSHLQSPAV